MQNKAEMRFSFQSEQELEAALKALRHEEDFKKRTDSKVIREGHELVITVKAPDAVSLRAALNAYLRDMQVIEQTNDIEEV